jgi:hypothetical protein
LLRVKVDERKNHDQDREGKNDDRYGAYFQAELARAPDRRFQGVFLVVHDPCPIQAVAGGGIPPDWAAFVKKR